MEFNQESPLQVDELTTSKRYIIRILSLDRKEQKTFCTSPALEATITKANQHGCEGTKVLLAEDGCEICDDEAYLYYITKGARFMIAGCPTQWQPPPEQSSGHVLHTYGNDSSDLLYNDSTLLNKKLRDQPIPIQQLPAPSTQVDPLEDRQRSSDLSAINSVLIDEKFKNVDVVWNQIPNEIKDTLARGKPLDHKVHALTKHIVLELRHHCTNIPIRVLRMMSHRLVSRYPKSFHRPGQSVELLPTVLNLALEMRHYNNFLNRADKSAMQSCDQESDWQDYADEHVNQ